MVSYDTQVEVTKAANMAARSIADASEILIDDLYEDLFKEKITIQEFETEAIAIVRKSYRDSATIAKHLAIQMSDMPEWEPFDPTEDSEYLQSLISDVIRNVSIFEDSERDNKAYRNLTLRVKLSAVTGAMRGLTDAQLVHYSELKDMGFKVKKLWLANFVNNDPCTDCINLHGTQVNFTSEFPIPTLMKTSIYRDLQGPPLHVRCRCTMVILISTLENAFDAINLDTPTNPTTMDTHVVKRLPLRIFNAIIKVLRAITGRKND